MYDTFFNPPNLFLFFFFVGDNKMVIFENNYSLYA